MYMGCLDPDCGWGRVSLPPHVRGMMSSTTSHRLSRASSRESFHIDAASMLLTATFMRCWTLLRISCHLHSGVDIFHDSLHDYATQLSLISLVRLLLFAMINFPTLIFFFLKIIGRVRVTSGRRSFGQFQQPAQPILPTLTPLRNAIVFMARLWTARLSAVRAATHHIFYIRGLRSVKQTARPLSAIYPLICFA